MVLFAGLRISAARVLTWDEIDLDREDPKVKPRHGKNQTSRRWRTIPPNAVAWLERCPTTRFAPEYSEDRWNHLVSELLVKAGIEKKGANAMRHTFGTFAAKEFGLDAARQMMGQKRNSQQLEDHYLEYATKADAKAYFSILPSEE